MIRNILTALLTVIICAACMSSGQRGVISGQIRGAEGKTIYLESYVNNRPVYTDSTVAGADGSFSLVPSQPLEMNFYRLVLDKKNAITLITDSSESPSFKGDLGELQGNLRVEGSANTETLRELELGCEPFNKAESEARQRMSDPSVSPEERRQLNQSIIDSRKQRNDYIRKWLDTHSSTPAALLAVQELDPRSEMALYNKVFTDLEKSFGHTMIYKGMKQQVQMLSKERTMPKKEMSTAISAGKPAPEIALPDVNGKVRKLSGMKGKTVLLDFWASWCGPCRRENPNVVEAYKKYNKDGFEVFSVSLDKAREPWLQAIEKDKLIWPNHVSDLKWWESEAAKTYDVHSIPFTVLIDKEGTIIGHNLRGPMLEEKLKAIYGH